MTTIPVQVTVRNASGLVTSASASFDVTTVSAGTIPMSFNDPVFANAAASGLVTLSNGQSLTDKKITDTSGNQAVTMLGNNTLTRVSISAREGPRIAGGGFFSITSSWLETNGTGADHADSIQAYAPGSNGTLTLKDSTIRAYSASAAGSGHTGSVGMFIADGWGGKVAADNVLFWGGQYGCRIFPDQGDIHVDFNNVFFVGPFGFGKFDIRSTGGKIVVDRWNNVRDATVVNGVIVPGALLASP
jgi:hypothetical protein